MRVGPEARPRSGASAPGASSETVIQRASPNAGDPDPTGPYLTLFDLPWPYLTLPDLTCPHLTLPDPP